MVATLTMGAIRTTGATRITGATRTTGVHRTMGPTASLVEIMQLRYMTNWRFLPRTGLGLHLST